MIGQETRDEEGICSPHVRSVGLDNIKVKWFSRCLDSFSQPYSSAYPCNLTAEYLMNRYMLPNTLSHVSIKPCLYFLKLEVSLYSLTYIHVFEYT